MNVNQNDIVRTDFVLENVFSYLVRAHYNFTAITAVNQKERYVLEGIKETLNAFKEGYEHSVKSLCTKLDISIITEDYVGSILFGVSNEVFAEGITWSHIITFFVFVGELAILSISQNLPESVVAAIYESFSVLVKEKLVTWIEDHNGWEGCTSLSIVAEQENLIEMTNRSWAKSFFHTTIRVIGTLASVANTANNDFNTTKQ